MTGSGAGGEGSGGGTEAGPHTDLWSRVRVGWGGVGSGGRGSGRAGILPDVVPALLSPPPLRNFPNSSEWGFSPLPHCCLVVWEGGDVLATLCQDALNRA